MESLQLSVINNPLYFGLRAASLSLRCSSSHVIFCATALLFNYTAQRKVSTDKSSESRLLLVLSFGVFSFFYRSQVSLQIQVQMTGVQEFESY